MTTPNVTWLLPVKNGMPFLPETLASIERQTCKDSLVLAWDNGSDDGTVEELRRWIPSRLPGQVVVSKPMGLGASLAAMVEVCDTEFCVRIDADDINLPERLELQLAFLQDHLDIALVGTQMNRIDGEGINQGQFHSLPLEHDDIVHFMLQSNGISHPTVLFRRSAVIESGNYRHVGEINVEDYDLWLRLAVRYRVANLPNYLLNYRVHSKSTTQIAMVEDKLKSAMSARLCEHAPNLFGCSGEKIMLMSERKHPCVIQLLIRIARHLTKTQIGSSLAVWQRMTSHSFVTVGKTMVSPRDFLSRGVLIVLGCFAVLNKKKSGNHDV